MGFCTPNGKIINTCMDCEDRHPACHDTCEKYQAAKAEHEKRKQAIRDASEFDIYKAKIIRKTKKKNQRKNRRYSKGAF